MGDNAKLLSTILSKVKNRYVNRESNLNNKNKNYLSAIWKNDKKEIIVKNIKKAQKLYRYRIEKVIFFLILTSLIPISLIGQTYAHHDEYRLPLPSGLEHQPSYSIRIPFGAGQTDSSIKYDPSQVAIPAGMTVVWFNDDSNPHSVTTISSAPERFDSGIIPPGGFSIMTFTKPGLYIYYDKLNPSLEGTIIVGDLIQLGKNMDMRIGGKLPFEFTELGRLVLSFVPKEITLPPPLTMTYNVTIYDDKMDKSIYNRQFTDIDGILDLEIIPIKGIKGVPEQIKEASIADNITTFTKQKINESITTTNATNTNINNEKIDTILSNTTSSSSSIPLSNSTIKTTTYGPDISSPITGTFHIGGPILVEDNDHIIKVEIVSIDGKSLSEPIEDVFILPAKI